jgi:hypothetical protein
MKVIETKYWKDHAWEFGYELGIANKLFYVKFWYPAYLQASKKEGNILKLYKKLSTAKAKILKFKKENGAK